MDSRMVATVLTGNINALYELIQRDPYLLERIDQVPFLDTPLHLAACTEHLPFVMEMINLKPSFARKLNQAGLSPMHIALQTGKIPTVLQLLKFDKGLIRVKGKEGMTPLHHAVRIGNLDILIKFLKVYPEAIEDVTVRNETVFHIAVKNNKFEAFEVLVGWLKRSCHKAAQSWEKELLSGDIEGNTVLHIAVIKNRPRVVKLLLENFSYDYINAKNANDLTALDVARLGHKKDGSEAEKQEIQCMLSNDEGLIRRLLFKKPKSPIKIDSLRSKLSCYERLKTATARGKRSISDEMRNIFLVVTVLIITTTYTASLAPPKLVTEQTATPDDMNDVFDVYSTFWLYNTLTFWASVGLTAFLLPSRSSICLFLLITLSLFGSCYMLLVVAVSADLRFYFKPFSYPDKWYYTVSVVAYGFSSLLALLVAYRIACYICSKLAISRRVFLVVMSLLWFVVIAVSIPFPAMMVAQRVWRILWKYFNH